MTRGIPRPEAFAGRPHGTRLRYISGCRCMLCRAANSRYECERAAARRRGDWNGIVSATRARQHLRHLAQAGVGRRAVAAAADVCDSMLLEIKAGRKRQIRARTERRILAGDPGARADRSFVDAGPTWRRIAALLEEGFTRKELARRLGYRAPALQLRRDRITARNAARVERLYRLLMEVPPDFEVAS